MTTMPPVPTHAQQTASQQPAAQEPVAQCGAPQGLNQDVNQNQNVIYGPPPHLQPAAPQRGAQAGSQAGPPPPQHGAQDWAPVAAAHPVPRRRVYNKEVIEAWKAANEDDPRKLEPGATVAQCGYYRAYTWCPRLHTAVDPRPACASS